jgi:hypothetical protein
MSIRNEILGVVSPQLPVLFVRSTYSVRSKILHSVDRLLFVEMEICLKQILHILNQEDDKGEDVLILEPRYFGAVRRDLYKIDL